MAKELLSAKWQEKSLEIISDIFQNEESVKAIVLVGSMADTLIKIDKWSDVDLKVILDETLLPRYYSNLSWLLPLGNIFSVERHKSHSFYTIRVCLENFQRFDITFITSGILEINRWNIMGKYKVLFSNINGLERKIDSAISIKWDGIKLTELQRIENNFWHKANNGIIKVMRNDLLIAHHLALDLARDCLVLQMIIRDKELNTNIHREGGIGNEIINDIYVKKTSSIQNHILESIKKYSVLFEKLSLNLGLKGGRYLVLEKFIKEAKE